ncbi:MAG: ABC transporter ATP-binding protein [Eubacterium sp.]|nr:ABC transporter ATP-binding protein [Eubacterium sp.]
MENKGKRKISKSDIATLKWIYSICRSERFKVYLLVLTNVIHGVLTIVFAGFSKKIIDAATVDKSFEKVIYYALMFLGVLVFQLCLNLISRSTSERCKAKIEWHLKQYMLKSIMKKDYASVSKYHTGELQNRMFNDVTVISDGFTTILPSVLFFLVRLISAFTYLVIIDKIFAVVFLVGGIAVFLCTQMFRKTLKRLHKDVQATEGKTRSFIQEAVTSLLVVKSFSVEKKIASEADELQSENYKAKMKRRFFGIAANAGISFVFSLGYVFALGFGAYRLMHGISYGTVTAMLQLVNQIQSPFAALSGVMPKYFSLVASAERLIEIDSLPDETSENSAIKNPAEVYERLKSINFNDISFSYDRDIILDNTSLNINKGDFIAIMGISGIGKSTLLKLLLGVFKVQDGNIELELDNEKIEVDNKTRRMFSYVPQGNFLLSGTIRDNLTFINDDVTEEEIEEAIRISCSDSFISELPEGIETVIGERGIGLSEGQLQRLAIARSLLSKAPVILLDEATSALDEETEKRFLTNLKMLDEKTCIIVSHKKAALEICNKHVQIVDSKIVVEEK